MKKPKWLIWIGLILVIGLIAVSTAMIILIEDKRFLISTKLSLVSEAILLGLLIKELLKK